MKQIKYHQKIPKELEPVIIHFFNNFINQFGNVVDESKILDLTKSVCPNHACIFNKIGKIGEQAVLLATNDELAMVTFNGSIESAVIYRCEDLNQ